VFGKLLVYFIPAAVQYYKLVTKMVEQDNIVNQAGEMVRLNDFVGNKNDKSFFTMCFDIGRCASKPLDKILIVAH
jgi:hypothetical protein